MILITIIFWLFCLLVLYLVIQWAIDNSKTAENIQEIRDMLAKQNLVSKGNVYSEEDNEISMGNLPEDECPACRANIKEEDQECPSCGLNFTKE